MKRLPRAYGPRNDAALLLVMVQGPRNNYFSDFVLAELAAQAIWQCLGNLHIDELSDQLLIIR